MQKGTFGLHHPNKFSALLKKVGEGSGHVSKMGYNYKFTVVPHQTQNCLRLAGAEESITACTFLVRGCTRPKPT